MKKNVAWLKGVGGGDVLSGTLSGKWNRKKIYVNQSEHSAQLDWLLICHLRGPITWEKHFLISHYTDREGSINAWSQTVFVYFLYWVSGDRF